MKEQPEGYMQQHVCHCMVDLAGEGLTTVEKYDVTWPEIQILQEIHGENAVYDIFPVSLVSRGTHNREKETLVLRYGRDEVEKVYAGRNFNMEFFVPGYPIDPAKVKRKPTDRPPRTKFKNEDEGAIDAKV